MRCKTCLTNDKRYKLFLLIVLLFPLFQIRADWIDKKAEGWAWYEDKEAELEVEIKETLAPPMTASEKLEEMNKVLKEKLAKALLEPTTEHVKDYMLEQKIAMEKATEFSHRWTKILLSNPDLDVTASENSVSSYGVQVQKQINKEQKDLLINKISKENGLFFLYRGGDLESQAFAYVVNLLINKYGFEVLGISIDGILLEGFKNNRIDNGLVEHLGIEIFPSLFVVNPKTENITPVSFGMRALDQVEENIFLQFNEEKSPQ